MEITFTLDDDLVAIAQQLARARDTSWESFLRRCVQNEIDGPQIALGAVTAFMRALVEYSNGTRPRSVTSEALGIEDFGLLIRILNEVGLPRPEVDVQLRESMVRDFQEVLRQHPNVESIGQDEPWHGLRRPLDELKRERSDARRALLRPQVELALTRLRERGVVCEVVKSYARTSKLFMMDSDVDILIEDAKGFREGELWKLAEECMKNVGVDLIFASDLTEEQVRLMKTIARE